MARIENVIFDMGGVLMDWDPDAVARPFCDTDEDARILADTIFRSHEWAWLDADAIDLDYAYEAVSARLPERLRVAGRNLAYRWHEAMGSLPETGELVAELKEAGYGIYMLSNAGLTFDEYRDKIPAIELFDGIVVSAFEGKVKPGAEIFQIVCDRYGLDAESCLFIDDTQKNVDAAVRFGMQGLLFERDLDAVRRALAGE